MGTLWARSARYSADRVLPVSPGVDSGAGSPTGRPLMVMPEPPVRRRAGADVDDPPAGADGADFGRVAERPVRRALEADLHPPADVGDHVEGCGRQGRAVRGGRGGGDGLTGRLASSIGRSPRPGSGLPGSPAWAAAMICCQVIAGRLPPVMLLVDVKSSFPYQTDAV